MSSTAAAAAKVELELRQWFDTGNRYPDKPNFVLLGHWKSPRQIHHYKANSSEDIKRRTFAAIELANDEQRKIDILRELRGVDYAVASTILHFAEPTNYMILDFAHSGVNVHLLWLSGALI